MKIKRFQATTMREAIRLVREEQGPDAVILSNRRIPGGVEVVAATDYDAALVQSASQRAAAPPAVAVAADSDPDVADLPAAVPAPVQVPMQVSLQVSMPSPEAASEGDGDDAPARWALLRRHRAAESTARPHDPTPDPAPTAPAGMATAQADTSSEQLNREIQTLRSLLEEQLANLRWGDMKKHRPRQAAAFRALVNLGLEPDLARSVAEEMSEASDPERARFLPLGLLGRRLPVDVSDPVLEGGVIALVGPTGVGKTTTVAKLAARYAAVNGVRDIALVTTDHYRIGAQEQLYTYGRLLGVPVHAVTPQDGLAATLSRLSDRKLVLIDTAGMSQHDKSLAGQLQQLKIAGDGLKTWLVMAGNAQPGAQAETVKHFGSVKLDGCVMTKLDEAHRIGGGLSVSIRHGLRINYIADGQRVPEDLHPARPDRLLLRATQLARQSQAPVDEALLVSGFSSQVHANG